MNICHKIFVAVLLLYAAHASVQQPMLAGNGKQILRIAQMEAATVAVSVCEATMTEPDSMRDDIRTSLLLSSEMKGNVENASYYFHADDVKRRADLDLLMLTQGWRRYAMDSIITQEPVEVKFEYDQQITGTISGELLKPKRLQLQLFVPKTGYRENYQINRSKHFCLTGLDFVDGTTYVLEITNKRGTEGYGVLGIDDLTYPLLSSLGRREKTEALRMPKALVDYASKKIRYNQSTNSYELPDVSVNSKRIIPKNQQKLDPDRWIAEGDHIFEIANVMPVLLGRLGLSFGDVKVDVRGEESVTIRTVRKQALGKYIMVKVILNDDVVTEQELQELEYLDPIDVRQMELFFLERTTPELYIWTWSPTDFSRFKRHKPVSMATVSQLGYRPPTEFYQPKVAPLATTEYRPTVYWKPNLRPDAEGKINIDSLWLDSAKHYKVTLEGVADNGKTVLAEITK